MDNESRMSRYKAFKKAFGGKSGEEIMGILAGFCCANTSTLVIIDNKVDPNYMMVMEGRRQVYLFILSCLQEPKEILTQEE